MVQRLDEFALNNLALVANVALHQLAQCVKHLNDHVNRLVVTVLVTRGKIRHALGDKIDRAEPGLHASKVLGCGVATAQATNKSQDELAANIVTDAVWSDVERTIVYLTIS